VDTPLLELRSIENVFPPRPERRLGPTALEVTGLSDGEKFREVDFHIRRGEIVGFSGLMGAGRTQVARAVFGLDPAAAGAIRIKGCARAPIRTAEDGMKRGMAMLSEDRERFRRFARPSEVAFAAMFLASEAAAMITGTNLVIDGGGAIR
jgi:ABC-type sugar transport system ATPase subunit